MDYLGGLHIDATLKQLYQSKIDGLRNELKEHLAPIPFKQLLRDAMVGNSYTNMIPDSFEKEHFESFNIDDLKTGDILVGRKDTEVGERVRFYRVLSKGKTTVSLEHMGVDGLFVKGVWTKVVIPKLHPLRWTLRTNKWGGVVERKAENGGYICERVKVATREKYSFE